MAQVKLNLSGHKNQALEDEGFETIILHVDLADENLSTKVAELLSTKVDSSSTVLLALPGLAPLASLVIALLHGLTGSFPFIQTLIRQGDGSFSPGPILDLQEVRNGVARKNFREGAIIL